MIKSNFFWEAQRDKNHETTNLSKKSNISEFEGLFKLDQLFPLPSPYHFFPSNL